MNVLITGAKGFIGKNLISVLSVSKEHTIFQYDIDSDTALLSEYTKECDFVIHLAGVNRPKDEAEYTYGNLWFTETLLEKLATGSNKSPVLMSSSIQAAIDNPYGRSKKAAEETLLRYSETNKTLVYIYRLPNVFGKWCRPNYNSVVATFCHNIANGLEIAINDPDSELKLVYIDDVVRNFINILNAKTQLTSNYCEVLPTYTTSVGELAELIRSYKENRYLLHIADMSDEFTKKLYATYTSYLPTDIFSYPLKMNTDDRGSFTEFLRTPDRGQISVNISKPGITKGNHWHQTKTEKFLVVKGSGVIRFRRIGTAEVVEYNVNGEKPEVVDIPVGYTHNIENTGNYDMVTVMWANEPFDPDIPDTIYEKV